MLFQVPINSGAEVAKETTVKPTTTLEIFSFKDSATEAFRSQSPPKINSTKPEIIKMKFINSFLRRYVFS